MHTTEKLSDGFSKKAERPGAVAYFDAVKIELINDK
jgi:hypothetical protein